MTTRVAITSTKQGIESAVIQAVNLLGGIDNFIEPGEPVLLKPNLFNVKPAETGCTTDLRIVLATARLLKEQKSHCIIGECPATASYTRPEMVYNAHNIEKICERAGIEVKVLDRDPPVKRNTNGKVLNTFYFPETATLNPIINFPKLKTHALTTLTCAVKNIFGLQQGGIKAHHHVTVGNDPEAFSHLLLDLYEAIKPQIRLNIVDAHIAMEGEGPASGEPVPIGLIIAGHDAVAVDLVASTVIGWDPQREVGTNFLAKQRGIGQTDLEEIEILGESIDSVKHVFKKPEIHQDGEMFINIRMPIYCEENKCKGCGVCEQICPAKAIKVHNIPEFNMEWCIQCFCCVELCPHNALKAQRPDE
jgi:uncharacterized protein (DUF362 family)/Pyruvate/2-oxoacid:ferredoxin oxidoreductase delta subunit